VPELTEQNLVIVAIAAVALLVVGLLTLIHHVARRRLERLLPAFDAGTAAIAGAVQPSATGLVGGYACRYRLEPASQYSPGGAVASVLVAANVRWSVQIADLGSRALVKLGILADHPIGDDDLDRRLRFAGADTSALLAAFGTTAARTALAALADGENFHAVSVKPDRCVAQWRPRSKSLDEDPQMARRRLEAVTRLLAATGCPPRLG
jgi:hypothetical protein